MGKSRPRSKLVEGEILERAAALFAERGFSETSLREVADAIGISRPALYHYISGKEDLLAKLVRGITRETAAGLLRVRDDPALSPSQRIEAAIRDMSVRVANSPARFRLLISSEASLPEPLAEEHLTARREALEHLTSIIKEGVDAGALKPLDERVAALTILGMCNWIAWWYRPDGRLTAADVGGLVSQMALNGLTNDHDRRASEDTNGVGHALNLLRQDLGYLERLLT